MTGGAPRRYKNRATFSVSAEQEDHDKAMASEYSLSDIWKIGLANVIPLGLDSLSFREKKLRVKQDELKIQMHKLQQEYDQLEIELQGIEYMRQNEEANEERLKELRPLKIKYLKENGFAVKDWTTKQPIWEGDHDHAEKWCTKDLKITFNDLWQLFDEVKGEVDGKEQCKSQA